MRFRVWGFKIRGLGFRALEFKVWGYWVWRRVLLRPKAWTKPSVPKTWHPSTRHGDNLSPKPEPEVGPRGFEAHARHTGRLAGLRGLGLIVEFENGVEGFNAFRAHGILPRYSAKCDARIAKF